MNFIAQLQDRWQQNNSLVCVGLDPNPQRFPDDLAGKQNAILEFNTAIIDATHDLVCAYKPQISYFAAQRAEDQLEQTIAYIHSNYPGTPVILDAKRGDIGATAEQYAIEAFERYKADAVTVNPYMGRDAVEPFTAYVDRGTVVLCRTSNSGAQDFQDLTTEGEPLYKKVARKVSKQWNGNKNCLLVVGATWPEQMRDIRDIDPDIPFLVPGVGAQQGDVAALVQAGQSTNGTGLLVSSSRAIIYASNGRDFAQAARQATLELRDEINRHRHPSEPA